MQVVRGEAMNTGASLPPGFYPLMVIYVGVSILQ
jgi:hypothetical protein